MWYIPGFLSCRTGSHSSAHDRTGLEERHVGCATELSLSNQLDVQTGKDMRRRSCSRKHTQGLQTLANQLSFTRFSSLHPAEWLVFFSLLVAFHKKYVSRNFLQEVHANSHTLGFTVRLKK